MTFVQSQPPTIVMTRPDMSRLSQETLAIIGATTAVAALILTTITGVRGEIQALRAEIQAVRAEARVDRAEARADRQAMRAEASADREVMRAEARADRQAFQEQILRLTEQQGVLGGQIQIIRNQLVAGG